MDELFSIEPQLSPRLEWMRRHQVQTVEDHFLGRLKYGPWWAWIGKAIDPLSDETGHGLTEDDAVVMLAKQQGWLMWCEEPHAQPTA